MSVLVIACERKPDRTTLLTQFRGLPALAAITSGCQPSTLSALSDFRLAETAIAFITVIGLPAHYIVMSHVRDVQSWGTPRATPAPHIEVEPEVKTVVAKQPEAKPEAQAVATKQPEALKTRQTCSKKTRQPKLQPMSVGAAAVDPAAMTSEQLRKECALQGVNWRSGGDYEQADQESPDASRSQVEVEQ